MEEFNFTLCEMAGTRFFPEMKFLFSNNNRYLTFKIRLDIEEGFNVGSPLVLSWLDKRNIKYEVLDASKLA